MTVRVGMRSVVSSARCTVTLSSSTSTTDSPSRPRDAEVLQRAQRLGGEAAAGRSSGRDRAPRRAGCARAVGSIAAEVAAQVAGDLGDLARPSRRRWAPRRRRRRSAARPGARGRARARPPRRPRGSGGGSSSAPSSDLSSAACSLPFVVAEVGVLRAAGDDQRVVLQGVAARCPERRRAARPGAPRGRRRPPRRGRRARCAAGGRCAAAGSRSPPARWRPWPPGRRAAGRGGSCADRPASPRPAGARASARPAAPPKPPPTTTTRCGEPCVDGGMAQILPDVAGEGSAQPRCTAASSAA